MGVADDSLDLDNCSCRLPSMTLSDLNLGLAGYKPRVLTTKPGYTVTLKGCIVTLHDNIFTPVSSHHIGGRIAHW